MADILDRIQNPLVRCATSALMGASAATIVAGGTLGLSQLENQIVNRFSLYAGVLGAGIGAVLGGVVKPSKPLAVAASNQSESLWTNWRNFKIIRKTPESKEITSFYLAPQDGEGLPAFQPGQFLTIKLDIPGMSRPVIRTYSLSDYAKNPEYYRLSIKREEAPKDQDVPPGVASSFMHDHVHEGSIIACKPPAGKFVLDVAGDRPVVLISNGVGITPMISMAKAAIATNPQRSVWFFHGARDGSYHAFREAVAAIAPNNANFHIHYCYSRPRPEDENKYHSKGYVEADLVKFLVAPVHPVDEAEYFLCGSPAFMDSLRQGLAELGVPASQVYFESFSKPVTKEAAKAIAAPGSINMAEIVFAKSGKTATWTPDDGTLLEFAEAQGLEPNYSCRAGICLTCMCRVEAGEVLYEEPPIGTPDDGHALICVSKPQSSKVVLDL